MDNGSGAGRRVSGGKNFGQQQKLEYERNPDMDPHIRVMEIFREFLCDHKRDGIMCPKGADSR